MPQYIWEGIFPILNVLVSGVVLALFAVYYQSRRKREIQIEGKLAIDRINGYEQILSCFYEGQDIHEVSLKEEYEAKAILGYFDVETYRYQCPNAFMDEDSFDDFDPESGELLLGDIVLCLPQIREQAAETALDLARRVLNDRVV